MTEAQSYAEYYYGLGWSLLPVGADKRPMVKWEQYQKERASLVEVQKWISQGWGLGLVTGKISGVSVLDDDRQKHGFNDWGAVSTVMSKTKNGGKHIYYKHIEGVTNASKEDVRLDVRGEGGYVVIPMPGNGYEWIKKPTEENIKALDFFPKVFFDMFFGAKEKPTITATIGTTEGSRDNELHRLACSLANETSGEDLYSKLVLVNNTFSPPLPEKDVRRIYEQATKFVAQHPKTQMARAQNKAETELKVTKYSELTELELSTDPLWSRLPCGIRKVDDVFDFPEGYYVIIGSPGTGKGFFATWLIRRFYELHKQKSIFFSLEMAESMVKKRLKQQWSDLTLAEYEDGKDTSRAKALMKADIIQVVEYPKVAPTALEFESLVDKFYDQGYSCFFLDHMHEIPGSTDVLTNQKVTEEWGTVFARLAKKHKNLWLFVFAQPKSEAYHKDLLRKEDFYGSKRLAQNCEFFMSLNAVFDDGVRDQRRMILHLDKSRKTEMSPYSFELYFARTGNFFGQVEDAERIPDPLPESDKPKDIITQFREIFGDSVEEVDEDGKPKQT